MALRPFLRVRSCTDGIIHPGGLRSPPRAPMHLSWGSRVLGPSSATVPRGILFPLGPRSRLVSPPGGRHAPCAAKDATPFAEFRLRRFYSRDGSLPARSPRPCFSRARSWGSLTLRSLAPPGGPAAAASRPDLSVRGACDRSRFPSAFASSRSRPPSFTDDRCPFGHPLGLRSPHDVRRATTAHRGASLRGHRDVAVETVARPSAGSSLSLGEPAWLRAWAHASSSGAFVDRRSVSVRAPLPSASPGSRLRPSRVFHRGRGPVAPLGFLARPDAFRLSASRTGRTGTS